MVGQVRIQFISSAIDYHYLYITALWLYITAVIYNSSLAQIHTITVLSQVSAGKTSWCSGCDAVQSNYPPHCSSYKPFIVCTRYISSTCPKSGRHPTATSSSMLQQLAGSLLSSRPSVLTCGRCIVSSMPLFLIVCLNLIHVSRFF